jgi:UDP-N-acetylglucosamine pyrophosphorylase
MNRYDEIKNLVSLSKKTLSGNLNENYNDILSKYGLLTEQSVESEEFTEEEVTE